MEEFIADHKSSLLFSLILFILIVSLKIIFTSIVRKVGKLGDFNPVRTNLIIKYINIVLTIISIITLTFIWGVNYRDLGVLLSSVLLLSLKSDFIRRFGFMRCSGPHSFLAGLSQCSDQ